MRAGLSTRAPVESLAPNAHPPRPPELTPRGPHATLLQLSVWEERGVRVISGEARGRKLVSVPGGGTRPITDRAKEALFSILGPDVRGARMLDLFAGTGSVGIEALSRGAEEAVFVDRALKAVNTVRRNLELTRLADRARVLRMDAFEFLRQAPPDERFHYVYVAPPQYRDLWARALADLDERPVLEPDGLVIVQIHPKEYRELALRRLTLVDERHYGSTALYFFEPRQGAVEQIAEAEEAAATSDDSGERQDAR